LTVQQKSIKINQLSKSYVIGKQKDSSLRSSLSGLFQNNKKEIDTFWALKDVSFEVEQGEVIGIIGRNGAGKSTLLKVLSKITQPTEGRIEINGRVASLLEVGTGFHPELTGRENIYLNGTLLGMSRKEVSDKLEEIINFSGVEKFIDTPVKHYSSGMYVRLAFSVAAHLEPEILIIDEVLAVGDAEFQKKCLGKMKDVAGEGRTVIFVSHDLAAVENLCTKVVFLEKGETTAIGSTKEMIDLYMNSGKLNNTCIKDVTLRKGNGEIKFVDAFWQNSKENAPKNALESLTSCKLVVRFDKKVNLSKTRIDIGINDSREIRIGWLSTDIVNVESNRITDEIVFTIDHFNLAPGNYTCNLYCETDKEVNDWLEFQLPFEVITRDYYNTGKTLPVKQGNLLFNYNIAIS
jgi:lipopolysaccharide transport system ATP-binding protein